MIPLQTVAWPLVSTTPGLLMPDGPLIAHPPEVKERALAIYMESGPAVAEQETGVPSGTIRSWASRAGVSVGNRGKPWVESRDDLMNRFGSLAWLAADEVERHLKAHDPGKAQKAMLAAAIAVDKAQLLSGGHTSAHVSFSATANSLMKIVENARRRKGLDLLAPDTIDGEASEADD